MNVVFESVEWISQRLVRACFYASERIVEILLDGGADPNYCSEVYTKTSPLHAVSQHLCSSTSHRTDARIRIMKMLLEAGADPNYTPSWGAPPIYYACCGDKECAVDLLVKYGANIFSNTCGAWAEKIGMCVAFQERPIQRERIELEKALLEYNADLPPEQRFPESLVSFVGEFVHLTPREPDDGTEEFKTSMKLFRPNA